MVKYLSLFSLFLISMNGSADLEPDCENALQTVEINECRAIELSSAEDKMERYFQASLQRLADNKDNETITDLKSSQISWKAYRENYCDAVYSRWREGTVRDAMNLRCRLRLTRQRTHDIWSDFLTFIDRTPAILPEPPK